MPEKMNNSLAQVRGEAGLISEEREQRLDNAHFEAFFAIQLENQKEKVGKTNYDTDSEIVIHHYPLYKQQILDYLRGKTDWLVTVLPRTVDDEFLVVYFDHLEKYMAQNGQYPDGVQNLLNLVIPQLFEWAPEQTEQFLHGIVLSLGDEFENTSSKFQNFYFNMMARHPNMLTYFSTEQLRMFKRLLGEQRWESTVGYVLIRELLLRGEQEDISPEKIDPVEARQLDMYELGTYVLLCINDDDYEKVAHFSTNYFLLTESFESYFSLLDEDDLPISKSFFRFFESLEDKRAAVEIAVDALRALKKYEQPIPESFKKKIVDIFMEYLEPDKDGSYLGTSFVFSIPDLNELVSYFVSQDQELEQKYIVALGKYKDPSLSSSPFEAMASYVLAGDGFERLSTEHLLSLGFSEEAIHQCRKAVFKQVFMSDATKYQELVAFYQTLLQPSELDAVVASVLNTTSFEAIVTVFEKNSAIFTDIMQRFFTDGIHPRVGRTLKDAVQTYLSRKPDFQDRVQGLTRNIFVEERDAHGKTELRKRLDNLTLSYDTFLLGRDDDVSLDRQAVVKRKYVDVVMDLSLTDQIALANELLAKGESEPTALGRRYKDYLNFRGRVHSMALSTGSEQDLEKMWEAIRYDVFELLTHPRADTAIIRNVGMFLGTSKRDRLAEDAPVWISFILEGGNSELVELFWLVQHLTARQVAQTMKESFSAQELSELSLSDEKVQMLLGFLRNCDTDALLPLFPMYKEALLEGKNTASEHLVSEEQRERIAGLEKKLGIQNDRDRLLEASLCIHNDLLTVHAFANAADIVKPELLYGAQYWENWLRGRVFMRENTQSELTVEKVVELAEILAKGDSHIRTLRVSSGLGLDNGEMYELSYSQIYNLERNGLACFVPLEEDTGPKHNRRRRGVIVFPSSLSSGGLEDRYDLIKKHGLTPEAKEHIDEWQQNIREKFCDGAFLPTKKMIETLLQHAVSSYNDAIAAGSSEPYAVAASLHRKIVETQPLEDRNGRLSRLILAWAQENAGAIPSNLSTEEDFLLHQGDHVENIRNAANQHEEHARVLQVLDKMSPSVAWLRVFYQDEKSRGFLPYMQIVNKRSLVALRVCLQGTMTEEKQTIIRKVLTTLQTEYHDLMESSVGRLVVNTPLKEYPFIQDPETGEPVVDVDAFQMAIMQNGAVTMPRDILAAQEVSSMSQDGESVQLGYTTQQRELIRKLYATEDVMYKGCMMSKLNRPSVEDCLRVFTKTVGVTASYAASEHAGVLSETCNPITMASLQDSQQRYNAMLGNDLEAKRHARQERMRRRDDRLRAGTRSHIDWNTGESQSVFTSFTLGFRTAWAYANGWLGDRLAGGKQANILKGTYGRKNSSMYMGMVVEAAVPKDGLYYTGNADTEVMAVGGILPETVNALYIYETINEEKSLYDADDPQVEKNTPRYKATSFGGRLFGKEEEGDPKPLTKPVMVFRRYQTEKNEYVVLTDHRKGKVVKTVYGLSAGEFRRLSYGYEQEVLSHLNLVE